MQILQDVPLALHSTMRLGGKARYLAEARSEADVVELAEWSKTHNTPIITIGWGSNIVWLDKGFDGLLLVNKITGREVLAENEDGATVRIGAGENWDAVIAWTVEKNLSGIETLSLIPGTAGATPVQNVEAYGEQIADTLQELRAYDLEAGTFVTLSKVECDLGYRTSRFKSVNHGRFVICSIVLKLRKQSLQPPFHRGLQHYIDEHNITNFSPASLRRAVIAIRSSKLPDPTIVANNGSFFKNPIIKESQFDELAKSFPDILHYPASNGQIKLSAQWLIEHAGFEPGHQDAETGMALWPKHALILVNEHAKSTEDLLKFKQKIVSAVQQRFSVTLEQEPELLP